MMQAVDRYLADNWSLEGLQSFEIFCGYVFEELRRMEKELHPYAEWGRRQKIIDKLK